MNRPSESSLASGARAEVLRLADTDLSAPEIARRLDLSLLAVLDVIHGPQVEAPPAFTVQRAHLNQTRVHLAFAGACHNLVLAMAREHGIEDPEEDWIIATSDQLLSRAYQALEWEALESPAEWKAAEAREAEQS